MGRSLETAAGGNGGGVLVGVRKWKNGAFGGWKERTSRAGLKGVRRRRRAWVKSHKDRVIGMVTTLAG